jgi:hypothetical protein
MDRSRYLPDPVVHTLLSVLAAMVVANPTARVGMQKGPGS